MLATRTFRIAGVVVLYNPQEDVVANIKSYLFKTEHLFVVDNSDNLTDNQVTLIGELETIPKISYISNDGNKGIAHALNVAAHRALKDKFDFLLTMDQDSSYSPDAISNLITATTKLPYDSVGIISPYHSNRVNRIQEAEVEEVKVTMTSGNLLNLQAFTKAGTFNEGLFIDYVDHEYCLRLRKLGYRIIQLNQVEINHKLGDTGVFKWLGFTIATSNHRPIRRYYMTRNKLSLISQFLFFDPVFCARIIFSEFEELLKIVFFEDHKLTKLKYSFKGLRDFLTGKSGKYE